MTINDLFCHRKNLRDVYKQLPIPTISEAGKEQLKLANLAAHPKRTSLLNGVVVDYSVALCMACVSSIDLRYPRKNLLTEDDKQYIAERMAAKFPHWSVFDLKCFEDMLISGRLPTIRNGITEYELSGINIPVLLSKAEVYDRMRPGSISTQGMSPMQADDKPLSDWQLHHLIDGTPHEWESYGAALHYWRSLPDKDNPRDTALTERVMQKQTL